MSMKKLICYSHSIFMFSSFFMLRLPLWNPILIAASQPGDGHHSAAGRGAEAKSTLPDAPGHRRQGVDSWKPSHSLSFWQVFDRNRWWFIEHQHLNVRARSWTLEFFLGGDWTLVIVVESYNHGIIIMGNKQNCRIAAGTVVYSNIMG